MASEIEFGQCLGFLLSTLGISINRLAKEINVDTSLVNRWVNGKRIPAYNSGHIESITEFLTKNVKNSIQVQSIVELFEAIHGYNDESICIQEKIKRCLYESQGYTLYRQKNRDKKHQHINPTAIKHLSLCPTHPLNKAISLSSNDKIISGVNNIIAVSNHLFNLALNTPYQTDKKIYLTYINEFSIDRNDNVLIHFQNLLTQLSDHGWEIHCLLKLTDNVLRTARFIDFIKQLIGSGNLHMYYVIGRDITYFGKEYVIVSGVGALSCFAINSNDSTAIYFSSPTATTIIKDYFECFISKHSQPLFTYYPPEMSLDFFTSLAESEDNFGNRILYKDCFSILALPFNLYKKLLKKNHLPNGDIEKALELYQKRFQAFEKNVTVNQYHDIYMVCSLNNLIKNRQLYLNYHNRVILVMLDTEDIIELLLNIIRLLQTYKNYYITFLPDYYDHPLSTDFTVYCLVKEREAVFIEVYKTHNGQPDVRLAIKEPTMVHAFEVYFQNYLEQLSPAIKDKDGVISWLRRQIEILHNQE